MDLYGFALKMESDGESYYRTLAEQTEDTGLKAVFDSLASDEKNHYRVITELQAENHEGAEEILQGPQENVFDRADSFSPTGISPKEVEAYLHARDLEKDSIGLYEKLCEQTSEKDRCVLYKLIQEEKRHFEILDDLIVLLNRPKDWVESAEFGIRKEY